VKLLKPLLVFMAVAMLLLALSPAAFSAPSRVLDTCETTCPTVYINNELIAFSAPPIFKKETVLVPASDLAEELGLGISFKDKTLHLFGNPGELEMAIDSDIAFLNK